MISITLEVSEEFINKIADASTGEFLDIMEKMNPIACALQKVAFIKMQDDIKENKERMLFINSDNLDDKYIKMFISNVAECYVLTEVMNKTKSED